MVSARSRGLITATGLPQTAEHALKAAIVSNETIDLFQPQYLDNSYLLELLAAVPEAYDALLLADTRFVLPAKDYDYFKKALEMFRGGLSLERAAWWIGLAFADRLAVSKFIVQDREVLANAWATSAWLVHPSYFPAELANHCIQGMSGAGVDIHDAMSKKTECFGCPSDIRRLAGLWRLGQLILERRLGAAAPSLKRLKCPEPPAWFARDAVVKAGHPGMGLADHLDRHAHSLAEAQHLQPEYRELATEVSELLTRVGASLLPAERHTRTAWMRAAGREGSPKAAYCAAGLINAQYHRVLKHSGKCDRIWTTESFAEGVDAAAQLVDIVEIFNESDMGEASTGLRIQHSSEGKGLDEVRWSAFAAWLRQPRTTEFWREARHLRSHVQGMSASTKDERRRESLLMACEHLAIAATPYKDRTGLGVRIAGDMDTLREVAQLALPIAEPLLNRLGFQSIADVVGSICTDLDALDASHSILDMSFEGTQHVVRTVVNAVPDKLADRRRRALRGAIFESVEAIAP